MGVAFTGILLRIRRIKGTCAAAVLSFVRQQPIVKRHFQHGRAPYSDRHLSTDRSVSGASTERWSDIQ
ncbi:hypothetical protein KM043_017341 [Ampulex compressa]|nr:hypothetical protein KM043_017341 [Ampulex compressa]